MKGEGGMPGAEGLKGEPGTPVRLLMFNYDALYEMYILLLEMFIHNSKVYILFSGY